MFSLQILSVVTKLNSVQVDPDVYSRWLSNRETAQRRARTARISTKWSVSDDEEDTTKKVSFHLYRTAILSNSIEGRHHVQLDNAGTKERNRRIGVEGRENGKNERHCQILGRPDPGAPNAQKEDLSHQKVRKLSIADSSPV